MTSDKQITIYSRVVQWLDSRYGILELLDYLRHKNVPLHRASVWYYFGGVSLFLFVVQVLTGILLLLYYIPGSDTAYESVKMIVSNVQFGWLVRSVHSWSANLMILALFIHMFSVFFTRAYRKPRELTWVTGILMLFLAMGFGFSGYLLPWNELAFFATKVGTDILGALPVIGDMLLRVVRGGDDVTPATLSRFFGLHVAVLPGIFTTILCLHLLAIQWQGMHEPEHWKELPEEQKLRMPFFPNFFLRDLLLWILVVNLLALLAVFFPWELGAKADPFVPTPQGIRPEWYFLSMFQTLKIAPAHVLGIEGELLVILGMGVAGMLWLLWPFVERFPRTKNGNVLHTMVGCVLLAYIVAMSLWGYFAS
ncbi:MAG: cytochrome bc complex cytochrome b subunit [bacterium]